MSVNIFLHLRNIDIKAKFVRKGFLRLRNIDQKVKYVRKHGNALSGIGIYTTWLVKGNRISLRIYFKILDLSVIPLDSLR